MKLLHPANLPSPCSNICFINFFDIPPTNGNPVPVIKRYGKAPNNNLEKHSCSLTGSFSRRILIGKLSATAFNSAMVSDSSLPPNNVPPSRNIA